MGEGTYDSQALGVRPKPVGFNEPPGESDGHLSLRTTGMQKIGVGKGHQALMFYTEQSGRASLKR